MKSDNKVTVVAAKALMSGALALSALVLTTGNAHANPVISAPLTQPCRGDNCDDPGHPPVPHTNADNTDPVTVQPPRSPTPIGGGTTGSGAGKDQTHS
jgi:hypothetical protein